MRVVRLHGEALGLLGRIPLAVAVGLYRPTNDTPIVCGEVYPEKLTTPMGEPPGRAMEITRFHLKPFLLRNISCRVKFLVMQYQRKKMYKDYLISLLIRPLQDYPQPKKIPVVVEVDS